MALRLLIERQVGGRLTFPGERAETSDQLFTNLTPQVNT